MKCRKSLLLIGAIILTTGCASTSIERLSPELLPVLPSNEEVSIFLKEADVIKPFTTIGTISHTDPGKYQHVELVDTFPDLKDKARSVGANGVIIDKTSTIYSGILSRGISVDGRVILIK